jgi:uncharacterized repeat protein (TIGR04076 family)
LRYNSVADKGTTVKKPMPSGKSQSLRRRDFCKTLSAAALLGWPGIPEVKAGLPLPHSACAGESPGPEKEQNMAKKVKEVRAKVTSVKGTCDLGHKVGDVVRFTDGGVDGHICIHAMYSMLPKVFAMMFNASFPWAQNPDVLTHACPDAENPVVFELTRVYED